MHRVDIFWRKVKLLKWLLFAILLPGQYALAQVHFTHLTYSNGLSSNDVRDLTLDKDGFLWIATADGLCRYDGRHFLTMKHVESDTTTLPEDDIELVFYDSKGYIWVGGYRTCSRIDLSTGKIMHIRASRNDPKQLVTKSVTAFSQDEYGNIWIGTRGGLCKYVEKENRVYRYFTKPDYFSNLKKRYNENRITTIVADKKDNLWCGTLEGINKVNIKTGSITRYTSDESGIKVLQSQRINATIIDGKGQLWIAYHNGGISILNTENNTIRHIYKPNEITAVGLWLDNKQNVWIATTNKQLIMFNSEYKLVTVYKHNDYDKLSLSDDVVTSMCQSGPNTWLGTLRHGLQMMNKANGFQSFYRQPGNAYTLPEENINNISIINDSMVLISHDKGLGYYNTNAHTYNPYRAYNARIDNLINKGVGALYLAPNGQYWAALDAGMLRIDPAKQAHYYAHSDSNIYSYTGATAYSFYKNGHGPLIIGSGGSLNIYDSIHDRFINKQNNIALSHMFPEYFVALVQDRFRHYWIATSAHGLLELDADFKELKHYTKKKNELPGSNITQLILRDDTLWISTTSGIALMDVRTHQLYNPMFNAEFISKNIVSISLNRNKLWFSTDNGLGCLSNYSGRWKVNWFDESDGLLCKEFSVAGSAQNKDKIYFAGTNGMVIVDVNRVQPKTIAPTQIKLTDFKVFDEHILNPLIVPHADKISLTHTQNFFSFSFSALDYPQSEKMRFAYKLIGFEDSIHYTGAEASGSYTNVSPGTYILEIYAIDFALKPLGVSQRIQIEIVPAFWQTIWFKLILLFTALGIVYLIYYLRLQQIHAKQELELEFNRRLSDIKLTALLAQMNPHFVFNSLSAINSMILNARNDEASSYLHKFSRLMRTVLDASDKKYITLEKELNLLKHYLDMEHMRFGQKFTYNIIIDEKIDPTEVLFPPMLLQPIVENSIKHGITHIEGNGLIVIKIMTDGKWIIVEVDDNGPGLKPKDPHQKKEHVSKGLQLTRERVEMITRDGISGSCSIENIETFGKIMGVRVTLKFPSVNNE